MLNLKNRRAIQPIAGLSPRAARATATLLTLVLFTAAFFTAAFFAPAAPALAQETETETEEEEQETQTPAPTPPAGEEPALFYPAFRNLDVVKLNENQMALLMINNQIEYLMLQIQEKDKQLNTLSDGFEERLQRERAEQAQLKASHAEQLKGMEEKVQAAEANLQASRQELHDLEKRVAAFLGDSGIYLVALIAALVGLILGLILSAILNWRRQGKSEPQKA